MPRIFRPHCASPNRRGKVDKKACAAKVGSDAVQYLVADPMPVMPRPTCPAVPVLAALLILLNLAPAMAVPADQGFREGLSAYNSGEFDKAMKIWMPLAQGEDAASQAGIGFMYHRGLGVAIDNHKAAYWLRKAAEHGQPEGQMMLGTLYFYGAGVEKSYVKAYAWCDLAQDGGNADAQECRDAALQSLASKDDLKAAFRLSLGLHQRFAKHP
ncbi:MAG TPA: tetratricopeptide repeat protein [Rhizomicrobium sp.]|nr:tetratricopeptide repeat protein [Rhizomicrobium sp.]